MTNRLMEHVTGCLLASASSVYLWMNALL